MRTAALPFALWRTRWNMPSTSPSYSTVGTTSTTRPSRRRTPDGRQRTATSQSAAPRRSSALIAVCGSLMPGDSARTATSTSCRTAYSRSAELARDLPSAVEFAQRGGGAVDGRRQQRERRARKHVVAGPDQQPDCDVVVCGPVRQAVRVDVQQIAAARIGLHHRRSPQIVGRKRRTRRIGRQPHDRVGHVVADQVDDGVDVDPVRHVPDEVHQHRDADEREHDRERQ